MCREQMQPVQDRQIELVGDFAAQATISFGMSKHPPRAGNIARREEGADRRNDQPARLPTTGPVGGLDHP